MAQDGAAMKAFMICRNFSANDGMFPGQRPGQVSASGVVQGLPLAIGTGRRNNRDSTASSESESGSNSPKSVEFWGGGSRGSPNGSDGYRRDDYRSSAGSLEHLRHTTNSKPKAMSRRGHHNSNEYMCLCHRAPVRAYGRCAWCLNEAGWA